VEPDKDLLQQEFTATELQSLWGRMKRARGKQPISVEDAWNSLKDLGGVRADLEKNNTLFKYVACKGDDSMWVEHFLYL